MEIGKSILIGFAIVSLMFFSLNVCAEDPPAVAKSDKLVQWTDITKKIYCCSANTKGWTLDEKAKVVRDDSGMIIKVQTTEFGDIYIDLNDVTAYKVDKDGKRVLLQDQKIFQRDHGLSIVLRSAELKLRCKFSEKIAGMKNVSGIKGM